MDITLELPSDTETWLHTAARTQGLPVGAYVGKLLEERAALSVANRKSPAEMRAGLMDIARLWHEMPTLDGRSADEILGYGNAGLPI